MKYTDEQLKRSLAKLLPEKVTFCEEKSAGFAGLFWNSIETADPAITLSREVLDTELLHLCWLVEESLTADEVAHYMREIQFECDSPASDMWFPKCVHATWQQRTIALAKVKGIEIV